MAITVKTSPQRKLLTYMDVAYYFKTFTGIARNRKSHPDRLTDGHDRYIDK